MDGNGNMNLRNWGFLDTPASTLKNHHLGLQLMPSISEKPLFDTAGAHSHTDSNPTASTNGGPFHPHRITESHIPMDYYWVNQNHEKYLNIISGYYLPSCGISPETPQPITNPPKHDKIASETDPTSEKREKSHFGPAAKKRARGPTSNQAQAQAQKEKKKKPRTKAPRAPRDGPGPKKQAEIEINGIHMNVSDIPTPVCSCTGTPEKCYRWGSGGWQSACCTTKLSVYPLPMSTKRRGARIAGRKMSIGAFKKVLEKLTREGYNFSSPIDLRSYWAKHGTNKFVTIRFMDIGSPKLKAAPSFRRRFETPTATSSDGESETDNLPRYTSLKDIILTSSPKNADDPCNNITIRNELVKHAASAYVLSATIVNPSNTEQSWFSYELCEQVHHISCIEIHTCWEMHVRLPLQAMCRPIVDLFHQVVHRMRNGLRRKEVVT
ncbi:GAGA-binding protein [Striga asiatica]|uniref:GAGA-binding transcriptional activator n=1 Tax=Striga asiatica TaxID=4170 RepID=A0A5A7QJP1_STRAF|nr:GAGA-binding protein [Striga asiatica]